MIEVAGTPAQAVSEADIVLVAAWPDAPVLHAGDVRPGTHVTSLGSDEPGKQELAPDLLASALAVVDDRRLATPVIGSTIDATLGELLRLEHPGRTSDEQFSICSPVGLPMEDCVIAWHAYQRAAELGLGTTVELNT